MQEGSALYWLLSDHLGSTAVTAFSGGSRKAELRYKAWGETRYTYGTTPTSFRFTGQREDAIIDLYFYNSRYYDPALGRFIQPDTIVPNPGDPQDLNRYTYVRNNPVRYIDPSGYCIPEECPGTPQVSHPEDYAGPYDEGYDAWLIQVLLWLEREQVTTGGMLSTWVTQRSVAAELAHRLMQAADPQAYWDMLFQEVFGALPQLSAQAAGASTDILLSGAGRVLAMVKRASRIGLPSTIGGTRIYWPSAPHNPRGGHWGTIVQKVQEMAASGEYGEIYVNKSISTATGGQVQSRLRPDIIGVRKGGGYDVFEVVSPSQEFEQLQSKIEFMKNNLFGALMVNGKVIEP